jgi:nucleotide-binding universal stress UspA family protein
MTRKQSKAQRAGQKVTGPKTTESKLTKKWVFAVDPFSDLDYKPVAQFVKASALAAGARVYGAYILAPETLNWTGDFSGPWLKRYKPVAEGQAADFSVKSGVEVEVVPSRKPGLKHTVGTLVKYAQKIQAECIVVSTHARSGIDRWVLGSFAESVLLTSKIPVLSVNPTQTLPRQIKRIFVPTDLSPQSTKFILKVADFAKRTDASMKLFFRQPDPLDPMIQQGVYAVGGGWVSVQHYLDEGLEESKQKIAKICDGIRKRGINCDIVTATAHGSSSLVTAIENSAKEHEADVIAVLTQSGPVAATLLGSVARSLVRTSPIPVMIYR